MSNESVRSEDLFVDFGFRKPHILLIGGSDAVRQVRDLRDIHPTDCRIFIEDGHPRHEIRTLAHGNQVFSIDGKIVHTVREARSLPKSDENDVFVIRDLARTAESLFRRVAPEASEHSLERIAYAYYCHLTDLIVSLKNRRRSFERDCGSSPAQVDEALSNLEKEKELSLTAFRKYSCAARKIGVKGLGVRYLAGILIMAHPARFRSLSAYLAYCGYKGSSKRCQRPNLLELRRRHGPRHRLPRPQIVQVSSYLRWVHIELLSGPQSIPPDLQIALVPLVVGPGLPVDDEHPALGRPGYQVDLYSDGTNAELMARGGITQPKKWGVMFRADPGAFQPSGLAKYPRNHPLVGQEIPGGIPEFFSQGPVRVREYAMPWPIS